MDYLISISDQLAPQLRSLRKARGLSQADLAGKLGVSQSRVAAIERHPAAVSAGQLLAIIQALNVDLVLRDTLASVPDLNPPLPQVADTGSAGQW